MAAEQAVFVIDGYERPREVCVLPTTRPSTVGGPEADIDVGAGQIVATVFPGWRIEHRHRAQEELHHGQRIQLGVCTVQFLVTTDVARELETQRYVEATVDPLTGTFNRRFVNAHAQRIVPPAALLAIDLDRFKSFNDQHGMSTGDRVLQETASRLRRSVQWPELVARIGGEEFLVILPATSVDRAVARAETIRLAIAAPFELDGSEYRWTASIGVAMVTDTFGDALSRADENLDAAKTQGRDRVIS